VSVALASVVVLFYYHFLRSTNNNYFLFSSGLRGVISNTRTRKEKRISRVGSFFILLYFDTFSKNLGYHAGTVTVEVLLPPPLLPLTAAFHPSQKLEL
jgi:hypothetical protein